MDARRLLHRWFVEYNPLYLLSAMLVLFGTFLSSRGLAEDSVYGGLGVAAIAEVYAFALIGGAALLYKIGHRRSAVMLGLLTALYQADLTLHTEACPNLGTIGVFASLAWLAVFAAKLTGIARALRLQLSRWTLATAMLGAGGLMALPYLLHAGLEAKTANTIVAIWFFALASLQPFSTVRSRDELDAWGTTVLRRSLTAIWALWGLAVVGHVAFWSTSFRIELGALMPVVPMVAARYVRREGRFWALLVATLGLVALRMPEAFAVTSLLAAGSLALRARMASLVGEPVVTAVTDQPASGPYRASEEEEPAAAKTAVLIEEAAILPGGVAAVRRLLVGSVMATYLSACTTLPEHIFILNVVLTLVLAFGVWRHRARIGAVPLGVAWTHFAISAHLVPTPQTMAGWGGYAIAMGFFVLFASLGTSYWLKKIEAPTK